MRTRTVSLHIPHRKTKSKNRGELDRRKMVWRWNVGKTAVLAVFVICILPGTTTYDLCIAMCGVPSYKNLVYFVLARVKVYTFLYKCFTYTLHLLTCTHQNTQIHTHTHTQLTLRQSLTLASVRGQG